MNAAPTHFFARRILYLFFHSIPHYVHEGIDKESRDGKIEHAHDVGMRQASERLGLGEELFDILVRM